jgi:hypothetical protein
VNLLQKLWKKSLCVKDNLEAKLEISSKTLNATKLRLEVLLKRKKQPTLV